MTHPVAELRLQILANGYPIIPVNGKVPELRNWQNTKATPEAVSRWPTNSTGVLTATMPALDLDVLDPEAADALEEAVKEWVADRGTLLVRFGSAPKRAIPFRTTTPFAKVTRNLVDAHGRVHRVELLGSGQQIVVHGPHAETKRPYSWAANRSPATVPYNDLPQIDGAEALQLVDYLVTMLVEQFGFTEGTGPTDHAGANGSAAHAPLGERIENMEYSGVYPYNDTLLAMTMDRLDSGIPVEDVIDEGLELVRRNAPERNKDGKVWDWNMLRKQLGRMCYGHVNKKHSARPQLIDCLPDPIRARWRAREAAGETNIKVWWSGVNGGSWCVRGVPAAEETAGDTEKPREEAQGDPPPARPGKKTPTKLVLRPFTPIDVVTLPPRTWLYSKHYQRKTVSLTAGPGGMGKSSLDMVEAVAMATCRNLLGEQPTERLRVWLHNGEDPLEEINRRLVAICQHFEIPQEELVGYLWITSGNEFPLRVAKGYADLKIDEPLVRLISESIAKNGIDLAMFDPLVTLHSVSEVDSGKMDTVIRLFAGIGDENDAGIELAHHMRKHAAGASGDYDVHDIRGVAAITDAVRAARVLNRMSEKEAEAAGCTPIERMSRFRVDRAKGNYSPAQAATWRQFISVPLANGDDVGVVAPWDYPGQGEPSPEKSKAEQAAETVFLRLLDKYAGFGVDVSARGGPTFAPTKFADDPEAVRAKVSKVALKAAMGRLLEAGRVRSVDHSRSGRPSSRLVPWQGDPGK